MKTEYGVQMLRCGGWYNAVEGTGAVMPYDTYDDALRRMQSVKAWWDKLLAKHGEIYAFPEGFRVVKREISEWEPVETR